MSSPHPPGAQGQLAALSVAMILGMTPWFSATVAAPGMVAEWGTTSSTTAWLTIAVQLGFVVGTFVSAALLLSDRMSARYLAAASALLAGVATVLLARRGTGPSDAITLRVITGIALAGVYPPGIKIAAGWWRARRESPTSKPCSCWKLAARLAWSHGYNPASTASSMT